MLHGGVRSTSFWCGVWTGGAVYYRIWFLHSKNSTIGIGFVSLTEALDLTTPTGQAMAGLLSVFAAFEHEILRERVRRTRSCPAERKAFGTAGNSCGEIGGRPQAVS